MRKISKKRRFHEQVHITDLLFSLGLLCLFTISSLTVLLIGAHVYKQTALDMKTNYTTRTALTYVAEKVRQHDSTSSISLGTLEDAPALELSESIGGVSYITYIYEDENALKEVPASVEDGIIQYFKEMDSRQRELIQKAIENSMPDLYIRRMFVLDYEKMKQFYDAYFSE